MLASISGRRWVCTVASSYSEIVTGLSGRLSLAPGTGMLFDLGYDHSRIDINMQQMLFPLDIIFISSNLEVVGVLHDVQPGEEAYFEATRTPGARFFLEVNAGEASDINVGDPVTFEGCAPIQEWSATDWAVLVVCLVIIGLCLGYVYKH